MPNKYSHAFVLKNYEYRGLVNPAYDPNPPSTAPARRSTSRDSRSTTPTPTVQVPEGDGDFSTPLQKPLDHSRESSDTDSFYSALSYDSDSSHAVVIRNVAVPPPASNRLIVDHTSETATPRSASPQRSTNHESQPTTLLVPSSTPRQSRSASRSSQPDTPRATSPQRVTDSLLESIPSPSASSQPGIEQVAQPINQSADPPLPINKYRSPRPSSFPQAAKHQPPTLETPLRPPPLIEKQRVIISNSPATSEISATEDGFETRPKIQDPRPAEVGPPVEAIGGNDTQSAPVRSRAPRPVTVVEDSATALPEISRRHTLTSSASEVTVVYSPLTVPSAPSTEPPPQQSTTQRVFKRPEIPPRKHLSISSAQSHNSVKTTFSSPVSSPRQITPVSEENWDYMDEPYFGSDEEDTFTSVSDLAADQESIWENSRKSFVPSRLMPSYSEPSLAYRNREASISRGNSTDDAVPPPISRVRIAELMRPPRKSPQKSPQKSTPNRPKTPISTTIASRLNFLKPLFSGKPPSPDPSTVRRSSKAASLTSASKSSLSLRKPSFSFLSNPISRATSMNQFPRPVKVINTQSVPYSDLPDGEPPIPTADPKDLQPVTKRWIGSFSRGQPIPYDAIKIGTPSIKSNKLENLLSAPTPLAAPYEALKEGDPPVFTNNKRDLLPVTRRFPSKAEGQGPPYFLGRS